MAKTHKPQSSEKRRIIFITVGLAVLLAASFAIVPLLPGGEVTTSIYRAWYADTPGGAVVVVEHGTHTAATYNPDSRRDSEATSTIRLKSYRVSDGKFLGSYGGKGFKVVRQWQDKLWVKDGQGNPSLLSMHGLETLADRRAIGEAIGEQVGGDFKVASVFPSDPYTGRLGVDGADGKSHWVTTDLRHEVRGKHPSIVPEGYNCRVSDADELIEPRLELCLPPQAAPATALATSWESALDKKSRRLSAVAADDAGARVLWSKSLAELVGAKAQPFLSGTRVIEPQRTLVMLRTDGDRLHLLFLDPVDGTVQDRKVLFGEAHASSATPL